MRRLLSVLPFTLLILGSFSHAQEAEFSLLPTEIEPGLVMLEAAAGCGGCTMVLVIGEDGVVLIDDGIQPYSDLIMPAVEKFTKRPVDYVINTHIHGDHTGSNTTMHEHGATIVGHENIRDRMLAVGMRSASGTRPAEPHEIPQITFSDEMTFHLNGYTVHIIHPVGAHTDGDGFIHFPDINVIHTGDIYFNGIFPFIDLDSGGTVDGYLAAQAQILGMADDDTRIVPGHGSLSDRAGMQAAHDMLTDANARVKALLASGKSADEILVENPLADYHDEWSWAFITTERMTETLIRGNTSQ